MYSLKGKNVILIPDKDNEGREHMEMIGASLYGIAANLKWVDLPDLTSKGDVSDFIDKFKSREEAAEDLSILIEKAGPYEPFAEKTLKDAVLEISQFCSINLPPRMEYLSPWMKEGSIGLISGWRGTGKTWFVLGILDAVTKGTSFGLWECNQSVHCLFLDGEMPIQDIIERSKDLGLNSDRKNPLYVYSDSFSNRLGLPRADLADESWRHEMKLILIDLKVKLWVIDNLASLASGLDENKKQDWDPINSWLLELRFAGISTLMLHHVNKEGGQRGTSAREDSLDFSIMLKRPHDYMPEDGARFIVHFSKSRVKAKLLNLIDDTEFKLILNESGQYVWTHGNVRQSWKKEILRMLDEGLDQKTIAESLGISKSYVSQTRSAAIKKGLITKKNKLTQIGIDMF